MDNSYITLDTMEYNIPECFVIATNKQKGAGSGESRLYIGTQKNNEPEVFFDFSVSEGVKYNRKKYDACSATCYLDKDNLINYMDCAKNYYMNPSRKYIGDLPKLYAERVEKVKKLIEYPRFIVFNQNGSKDSERLYLGSISPFWKLIREISIFGYTEVKIDKLLNETTMEICYLFRLYIVDNNEKNEIHGGKIDNRGKDPFESKKKRELKKIDEDITLSDTQKKDLIVSRKGQGLFRNNTLALMPKCPFTGIDNERLLRASHIIPWVECNTASDRLDGYNGLTLTPTYDVLFDQGFISFEDDGSLIISEMLDGDTIERLNLVEGCSYIDNSNKIRNRFLEYHRKNILKK